MQDMNWSNSNTSFYHHIGSGLFASDLFLASGYVKLIVRTHVLRRESQIVIYIVTMSTAI